MSEAQTAEAQLISRFKELQPIAQLFLTNEEIDTRICINNFFSTMVPEVQENVSGQFFFFSETGNFLTRKKFTLPYNGSLFLSVSQTLQEAGFHIPLGTMCCALYPEDAKNFLPYIGKSFSQFYVCFQDRQGINAATVHPQTRFGDLPHSQHFNPGAWRSSQCIMVKDLESLDLHQLNATVQKQSVSYSLHDFESRKLISKKSVSIEAYGAGSLSFSKQELNCASGAAYLMIDNLLCKPLLMRRYSGGRFSASHA